LEVEVAVLMETMHLNHLVAQLVVADQDLLTAQVAEAVEQAEQDAELGDKTKNTHGECIQDMLHIHQHQMKDLLQVDMECVENLHHHSQQLADKAERVFTDLVAVAEDQDVMLWEMVLMVAEQEDKAQVLALMEHKDKMELLELAVAVVAATMETDLELAEAEHA
jgi:hypothetical protein